MAHQLPGVHLHVSICTQAILHPQIILESSLQMQPWTNLLCYNFPQGIALRHRTVDLNSKPCSVYFDSYLYCCLTFFVALTLQSVGFYTFILFLSGINLDTGTLGLYTSL